MPPPTTPAAVAASLPLPLPNWFPATPPAPAPTSVPQPLSNMPSRLTIAMIRIAYLLAVGTLTVNATVQRPFRGTSGVAGAPDRARRGALPPPMRHERLIQATIFPT